MAFKRQKKLLFAVLLVLFCFMTKDAEAHRDYLIKEKIINTPEGKIIIEKHFGDGIILTDPLRLQVRNTNGEVVAYTPVATHIGVFCPSLEFCVAVPHGTIGATSQPWKLSVENIYWDKTADPSSQRSQDLVEYLEKDSLRRTTLNEYLSGREDDMMGFETTGNIYLLLSPLLIIACYPFPIFFMLLMGYAPHMILAPLNEKPSHVLTKVLGFALTCGYTITIFALLLGTLMQFVTPVFYMVVFFSLGLYLGKRQRKRKIMQKVWK